MDCLTEDLKKLYFGSNYFLNTLNVLSKYFYFINSRQILLLNLRFKILLKSLVETAAWLWLATGVRISCLFQSTFTRSKFQTSALQFNKMDDPTAFFHKRF